MSCDPYTDPYLPSCFTGCYIPPIKTNCPMRPNLIIYPRPPAPIPIARTRTLKFLQLAQPKSPVQCLVPSKCQWGFTYPGYCQDNLDLCVTGGAYVPKTTVCNQALTGTQNFVPKPLLNQPASMCQ
jgi:hypothetical protein